MSRYHLCFLTIETDGPGWRAQSAARWYHDMLHHPGSLPLLVRLPPSASAATTDVRVLQSPQSVLPGVAHSRSRVLSHSALCSTFDVSLRGSQDTYQTL